MQGNGRRGQGFGIPAVGGSQKYRLTNLSVPFSLKNKKDTKVN